jgi:hypothetical protein
VIREPTDQSPHNPAEEEHERTNQLALSQVEEVPQTGQEKVVEKPKGKKAGRLVVTAAASILPPTLMSPPR